MESANSGQSATAAVVFLMRVLSLDQPPRIQRVRGIDRPSQRGDGDIVVNLSRFEELVESPRGGTGQSSSVFDSHLPSATGKWTTDGARRFNALAVPDWSIPFVTPE